MSPDYYQGAMDYIAGHKNPYIPKSQPWKDWNAGWADASMYNVKF